jgi:phospholipase C
MADRAAQLAERVFVLMLENRSFDHLLGFSRITGKDAETGQPTAISGLSGSESNPYNGPAVYRHPAGRLDHASRSRP